MLKPENSTKGLLLVSCSTKHGHGYLDHAESEIRELLKGVKRIVFVPYALYDRDAYAAKAAERFDRMGLTLESVHSAAVPRRLIEEAEAIFIGGGNTFRLLKNLQDSDLFRPIRAKAGQ